ncbi:MAG: hypothetical protein F6K39_42185 [Okeania sp. SIO3B3]|nr:hypothetical protein [Okeania sp. SIO3B3]
MKIFLYYPLKRGGAYPQFFGKNREEGRSEGQKNLALSDEKKEEGRGKKEEGRGEK